jgi:antitoxin PrlF
MAKVSSMGQITIPKAIRDALNLSAGARLRVELRGQEIILSKELGWKKLEGAAAGTDLIKRFASQKESDRSIGES